MIQFTKAYTVEKQTFATLDLAQEYELELLLSNEMGTSEGPPGSLLMAITRTLVTHKAKVLDILTFNSKSRPGARGVKKPRKSNQAAITSIKQ